MPEPEYSLKNLIRMSVSENAKLLLLEMIRRGSKGDGGGGSFFLFDLAADIGMHPGRAEEAKRVLEQIDACFKDVPSDRIKMIANTGWEHVLDRADPAARTRVKELEGQLASALDSLSKVGTKAETVGVDAANLKAALTASRNNEARLQAQVDDLGAKLAATKADGDTAHAEVTGLRQTLSGGAPPPDHQETGKIDPPDAPAREDVVAAKAAKKPRG